MKTSDNKTSRSKRHWSTSAVFLVAWAAVIGLCLLLTWIGVELSGGPLAFRSWTNAMTPYSLIWRIFVYVVGGMFYIQYFRPKLRDMQQRQSDDGAAAHARLVKVERMLLVVLVVMEASNLPGIISWIQG